MYCLPLALTLHYTLITAYQSVYTGLIQQFAILNFSQIRLSTEMNRLNFIFLLRLGLLCIRRPIHL